MTCDHLCDLSPIYAELKGFAMVMDGEGQSPAEDNGLSRELEAFTEGIAAWQKSSVSGRFWSGSVNSLDNRFV